MKWYLLILWPLLFQTNSLAADEGFSDPEYLLAVITNQFSHDFELTIIDIEGRKAYDFPESIRGNHPAWSPCGEWIALEQAGDIFLVSADGSTSRLVTNDQHTDYMPVWSPDGRQVVYFSSRDGNHEVMIVNADGSDVRNLTNDAATDADPAWCPRGEEILFLSNRSKDWRLYIVGSDRIGLRLFSDQATQGWTYPAWHPNGQFLAYAVREQSGAYQLLISDRSGRKTRRITQGSGVHSWASWSPDGRYLAYCRLEQEPNTNETNGDLMVYDVLRDNHRPVLAAALPKSASRVSWKPFVPRGGQQVVPQASEAVEMEASDPAPSSDAPPPFAVAPFDSTQARQHQESWAEYLGVPVEWTNWLGMKFVLIPPGEFMMGSTEDEVTKLVDEFKSRNRAQGFIDNTLSEAPQHLARISKPFYIGMHEVTQYQYELVVGMNPSHFQSHPECDCTSESQRKTSGSNATATDLHRPVELVTWEEAVVFCRILSASDNNRGASVRYTLPTEAQWEYACRAGTTARYYFGEDIDLLDEYAWWIGNANKTTHPVGQKLPNAWGLHDMVGNVWNWCSDFWTMDYYANSPVEDPTGPTEGELVVQRGGAWSRGDGLHLFRSTQRAKDYPNTRHHASGFRVVAAIHY